MGGHEEAKYRDAIIRMDVRVDVASDMLDTLVADDVLDALYAKVVQKELNTARYYAQEALRGDE